MSAMDFQRHFVPGSKEPFRRIVSYISCIFISKSWLVWTHHLIVIINEKVNGKSPLSRATDSLLINLRSFPPFSFVCFFFYKKRNVLSPSFSLLFPPIHPIPPKKVPHRTRLDHRRHSGASPKCRRREKKILLYASVPAIFEMPLRYKLVIEFSKEESTTSYFTSSAHRTRIFRSFVF